MLIYLMVNKHNKEILRNFKSKSDFPDASRVFHDSHFSHHFWLIFGLIFIFYCQIIENGQKMWSKMVQKWLPWTTLIFYNSCFAKLHTKPGRSSLLWNWSKWKQQRESRTPKCNVPGFAGTGTMTDPAILPFHIRMTSINGTHYKPCNLKLRKLTFKLYLI